MRPYQRTAIENAEKDLRETDISRILISIATGGGKTIIFSEMARRNHMAGGRSLILAHTEELIDQAVDKFQKSTGLRADKEKAEWHASRKSTIVVGSVQTLCGDLRLSMWPKNHFSRIFVDEAHRSLAESYQKILKHFVEGGAKVIGVTATADRGDRKSLGQFYQKISFDYGLVHAVRDGWLVKPMVQTINIGLDLKNISTKRTADGEDFDRAEVGRRLSPMLDEIARQIHLAAPHRKTLIFMPSVETAQMMSDAFRKMGLKSDWVCGDKKICPDRAQRVERHKRGEFQYLCNMAILTEGYDDDQVDCIVCLRPTKIRGLYCQIIGRGTRPHSSIVQALNAAPNAAVRHDIIRNSVKPFMLILDFLWLYEKHDLIKPASLVTPDERVARQMGDAQGDLMLAAAQAERDLLKKLEQEVRKNARREAKVIDPLAFATELADFSLATYEPITERDNRPASDKMLSILRQNGLDTSKITSFGQAHLLVGKILERHKRKLSTVRQLNWLATHGIDASMMTMVEAKQAMDEFFKKKQSERDAKKSAQPQNIAATPNSSASPVTDDVHIIFDPWEIAAK